MSQALAPFTLKGFYLLTWGTALGTNVWNTLSGAKAYTTLNREAFSHLTASIQPAYFGTSTLLTGALLATHLYFHPILVSAPFKGPHWWQLEEGVQGLLIVAAFVPQLLNWVAVGPQAIKSIYERHRIERAQGKAHDALNPSQDMQAANSAFAAIHNVASILNTISCLALTGLGLAVSM